ncbi:MAG: DUF5698 domain-containing protein [Candidatus Marinimicrobia bacterium]|nr:DUF5698 domain-containing protein [Candidatus Neomarinimicrobiota bacterium]
MEQMLENWWFAYIALPLLIFFARILDVSLGTIRILFIARGIKSLSALLGFFEVFIWLLVIASIMNNLGSPFYYFFYAAGFAAGNYVGITIETRLRIGRIALRVITRENSDALMEYFQNNGLGLTIVNAEGAKGPVRILYSILDRKKLEDVLATVQELNPKAFYSIEDVRSASLNFSSQISGRGSLRKRMGRHIPMRKGK